MVPLASLMKKNPNFKRNLDSLAALQPAERKKILEIQNQAIANFSGPLDTLIGAIGMLQLGHHVGWRVLLIIHNKRTIRKYEEILDIDIRDFFPEEGPSAHRNNGFKIYKKLGGFWKIVSGDTRVENKRELI